MARRAQSGLHPAHLMGILAIIAGVLIGGYSFLNRGTDPMTGVTPLNVEEFLENASALGGNTYRVEGVIDDRLDNWRASDGRLFSVQIADSTSYVPVLIPSSFEANVQRGQRYIFKVRVLDTGVLEAVELLKP